MEFIFLKPSGEVAFFRTDAEQAEWTQEEMSLLCTFPLNENKIIERGMIVLFQDPATGDYKAYEIRNLQTFNAEGYQQFTAEDICISELTDSFIQNTIEITSASAESALARVLTGTGWSVGTVGTVSISEGDIERGSVWDAVSTIRNNWNINIVSRITVGSSGITGKYLDIISADGIWRGVRLHIGNNVYDPCVTIDDTDLYTALYGYGASQSSDGGTSEVTFAGIAWEKTADHPAKPIGQIYLEDPEKTALYGRNGKPRVYYYQNSSIDDPETLLKKTWETLKTVSNPKISITGTAADLRRLGYIGQPMRLYDMAIVDLDGKETFYKQIIKLTVNLLDPTGNLPTIGDYIPSIIYINRQTNDYATGGGVSAGGRGGGGTRSKKKQGEFQTSILQNERNIELNARQIDTHGNILRQAGMSIDPVTGVLIYAEDNVNNIGSKFRVQSDRITSEVTNRQNADNQLSSRITQTANSISLEVSERKSADSALSSRITITAKEIRSEVSDTENKLSSKITQTAKEIRSEVSDTEAGLSSRITQNANQIQSEITARTAQGESLSSRITQTANEINATVESKTSKASLILAITDGVSSATITADVIDINGIVNALKAKSIGVGGLNVEGRAEFLSSIYGESTITSEGAIRSNTGFNVGGTVLNIADISESNNTLTITKVDGTVLTFSKATSLSGSWSGGIFTATAKQGNTIVETKTTTLFSGEVSQYTQWEGNTAFINLQAFVSGSSSIESTGRTISLNCNDIFDSGWNDCIDNCSRELVLRGYTDFADGRSVELYFADGSSAGNYVWRYGGITAYRYSIPSKK